jgi:ribosomal protein S12 methylthiotransferase accessory factor
VAAALSDSGLRVTHAQLLAQLADASPSTDLVVASATDVVAEAAGGSAFDEINRICLDADLTWLPVGDFDGQVLRVGPLIVPGQTACYECTITRLSANVDFAGLYREVLTAPAAPAPAAVQNWADSIAALIAVQWIGGRDSSLPGRLATLTPQSRSTRTSTVLRVPRCQACGAPDYLPAAAPWESPHDD